MTPALAQVELLIMTVTRGRGLYKIPNFFADCHTSVGTEVAIALVNWLHSIFWGDELFYSTLATVTSVNDQVRTYRALWSMKG